jgi:ferric iron reductase protein FhuF
MSELFIREINPVVRNLGYCCGQRLSNVECDWFNHGKLFDYYLENMRLKAENDMLKEDIAKLVGHALLRSASARLITLA